MQCSSKSPNAHLNLIPTEGWSTPSSRQRAGEISTPSSAALTAGLGEIASDPGRGELLGDVPPPGAPLPRERDIASAGEPRKPGPQVRPAGRDDLAAPHLPGHDVHIVEGQLLPVDAEPAYDGHRDLLKPPGRANALGRMLI